MQSSIHPQQTAFRSENYWLPESPCSFLLLWRYVSHWFAILNNRVTGEYNSGTVLLNVLSVFHEQHSIQTFWLCHNNAPFYQIQIMFNVFQSHSLPHYWNCLWFTLHSSMLPPSLKLCSFWNPTSQRLCILLTYLWFAGKISIMKVCLILSGVTLLPWSRKCWNFVEGMGIGTLNTPYKYSFLLGWLLEI